MKTILIFFLSSLLQFIPTRPHAVTSSISVAPDNSTAGGIVTGVSTLSYNHTVNSASNSMLLISGLTAGDSVTSITVDGSGMTKINSSTNGTWTTSVWCMVAVSAASHAIVVTSSNTARIQSLAASYTGAKQSCTPDAVTTPNAATVLAAGTYTASVTTTTNNSWIMMFAENQDSGLANSAGSATTLRVQLTGGAGMLIADSNTGLSIGSQSLNITQGAGSTCHWDSVMLAIAHA